MNQHLHKSLLLSSTIFFLCFNSILNAALVININDDANLGGVTASLADFQVADANLQADSTFFALNNIAGFNGARGAGALTSAAIPTAGGTTTLTVETTGAPQNNGFTVPADAFNAGDPILGSNLFDVGAPLGFDVTGLAALDAGSTIIVTGYGIGDNLNQDTTITADFGGTVQSGSTIFTASGDRLDGTGSVPFQQFTFVADGVTDLIDVDFAPGPGGQNRSHINGFSVSVIPIPEPSSAFLLIGLGCLFALVYRQRRSLGTA